MKAQKKQSKLLFNFGEFWGPATKKKQLNTLWQQSFHVIQIFTIQSFDLNNNNIEQVTVQDFGVVSNQVLNSRC